MSEKNFWNLIRTNLNLKMYRVENRVASGMPDVHYVSEKGSGWIELKYVPVKGDRAHEIAKGIPGSDIIDKAYWSHMGNFEPQDWDSLKGAINEQNKENFGNVGKSK